MIIGGIKHLCSRLVRLTVLAQWLALMPVAATAAPTLTVSQASVTVEAGRVAEVLLSADTMPAGARIAIGGDPGIRWSLTSTGPATWNLWVGPGAGLTSEATLNVQLIGGAGQRLALAQVKIVPKPRLAPDSVVQAALMLDGAGLIEGRATTGYLAITNKSEQAIAVHGIEPLNTDEITVTIGGGAVVVLPRATIVRPITITVAHGRVPRTGSHLLALDLKVTTNLTPGERTEAGATAGAGDWQAHVLVTKDVNLSVPGLSELQGVLQIPTLLLLPGLLAIIAFSAVLDLAKPRPTGENPLSRLAIVLSPGLWVVVIMVSFVIGAAYAFLAGRDILYGFGIRDVVWLWFISLVLGALIGWIAYCAEKKRQRAAAAPRFAPNLAPPAFLAQMLTEGTPLTRAARLLGEQLLFDLGPGAAPTEAWACGAIAMRLAGARDDQALAAMRSDAPDSTRVAAILEFVEKGKLALDWQPFISGSARVTAPQIVSTDLLAGNQRQAAILQETA